MTMNLYVLILIIFTGTGPPEVDVLGHNLSWSECVVVGSAARVDLAGLDRKHFKVECIRVDHP